MDHRAETRLAQAAVALAALVPVLGGGAGVLLGPAMLVGAWEPGADGHFRYLSGVLLGVGLAYWSCVPSLAERGGRFALLTALVVLGGLARLLGAAVGPGAGEWGAAVLGMELVVTPALLLWQRRLARLNPAD